MKFISTRGKAESLSFADVVLTGLASDGGLYVPESLPQFDSHEIEAMRAMDYPTLASTIMWPFVEGDIDRETFDDIVERSYHNFSHAAAAPLTQIDRNYWVLELFHGPTLAFKDFALQFLGNLLDHLLTVRDQKVVVMGATSGDTGSAAIEGCRGCDNIDIVILHPHNRVSDVQRRQMTTVIADNVYNLAIEGNFDDCQNIVKASFRDQSFLPEGIQLVAVNSINWARIMAQIVYYFYAALALGSPQREINFSVPTGNFGDIFAGYLAKSMGLPVSELIVATNANDILHRCISDNDHSKRALKKTLSPSMDIMVSSNFERLLFDLYARDGNAIAELMDEFAGGAMTLSSEAITQLKHQFRSFRADDDVTLKWIEKVWKSCGYLLDPHTAIGVAAAYENGDEEHANVCLATAHPIKFSEAIEAIPNPPNLQLPTHMADLHQRDERYQVLANDIELVQQYVAKIQN